MKNLRMQVAVACVALLLIISIVGCEKKTVDLPYDKISMSVAKSLGSGGFHGNSGVYSKSFDYDIDDFATLIYNTTIRFDEGKEKNETHNINESSREKFYFYLMDAINKDPKYSVSLHSPLNYAQTFEQNYGDLPNTRNTGKPDVVLSDDDYDKIKDQVDDDDDGDGCMDWDEADGNLGGIGNTYERDGTENGAGATGLGRGKEYGYTEPVETGANDPANPANGGDTSEYDNGK